MNTDLVRLQVQSRWLGRAVTGLVARVGLTMLLNLAAAFLAKPSSDDRSTFAERMPDFLVFWGPAVFYVWALLAIRRALRDVAAGRHLRPTLARSLRDVGWALFAGGIASAIVQPNLMRLTGGVYASYGHFDPAYLAVGAVGLALVLLARIMRQAADMRAELDEII